MKSGEGVSLVDVTEDAGFKRKGEGAEAAASAAGGDVKTRPMPDNQSVWPQYTYKHAPVVTSHALIVLSMPPLYSKQPLFSSSSSVTQCE
jgi:hypothetical protein